jgi:hypothetical protein
MQINIFIGRVYLPLGSPHPHPILPCLPTLLLNGPKLTFFWP